MACIPSTAAAERTHRCIAFYGVPNGPESREQFEYVDPCWGGAHVTVAGFNAYPTGPPRAGESLTASEALAVPRKIANDSHTVLCEQNPKSIYHMNDGKGSGQTANAFWEQRETLTLKLGNPAETKHISRAWKDLALDLRDRGVQTYFKSGTHGSVDCDSDHLNIACWDHNFPHVSFDSCSCSGDTEGSCGQTTWETWGDSFATPRIDWLLIPVEYTGNGGDCFTDAPPTNNECHPNPAHHHRQMACTSKEPLVWYWSHQMVVRCPEPSAAQLALSALLVLPTLGRGRRCSHDRRAHARRGASSEQMP